MTAGRSQVRWVTMFNTVYTGATKTLTILAVANVVATLFHYVDNLVLFSTYPELPTATRQGVVLFALVMMTIGLAGYWLYIKGERRASFYLLYIYCVLNASIVGHYTSSRLHGGFSNYGLNVHLFIALESITAVWLAAYVAVLHWRTNRPVS
jgi:hypothetical protein